MKVFGQEITPLTAAIAKTNLFLNGVKEFQIASGDTLEHPAFIENERLKQFDIVLANPPYSISQWNRTAFEHDKFGRNFLGTPNQGCADYAFFQHIIKSMNPVTGRCAILFPHGVLTRDEEDEMRKKLIISDLVECVIGIGKGLFYNCPMEACIVICRTKKPEDRKNKVLFIDAKKEVTRKNSVSFLEEKHINKIAGAYKSFSMVPEFSYVATIDTIAEAKYKLGVSRYVHPGVVEPINLDEAIGEWVITSNRSRYETNALNSILEVSE